MTGLLCVSGIHKETLITSACLLLLCICIPADARPFCGIWLSDRAQKRPVCVCVCVSMYRQIQALNRLRYDCLNVEHVY